MTLTRQSRAAALLIAAVAALVLLPATTAAKKGDGVLVMRFGWAPGFCYSGSSAANQVPRELCGFSGPALQRFWAHRVLRLLWATPDGDVKAKCADPTPGYKPSALTPAVRKALHCIGNAYTPGQDDGWHRFVWERAGACVAANAGLSTTAYYKAMADAYKRYNIDSALKKADIDLAKGGTIDGATLVDVLAKAFGKRGFYSCDPGSGSVYSTFSICLSPKPPHKITDCPAALLKPKDGCPAAMSINLANGGPVSKECLPYYPAFK